VRLSAFPNSGAKRRVLKRGLKPHSFACFSARLKSCPDTKQKTVGEPLQARRDWATVIKDRPRPTKTRVQGVAFC